MVVGSPCPKHRRQLTAVDVRMCEHVHGEALNTLIVDQVACWMYIHVMILVRGIENAPTHSQNQHAGVLQVLVKALVSGLLGSAAALPVCSSNVLRTYCVPDASRM
jgi:hypothetical protein